MSTMTLDFDRGTGKVIVKFWMSGSKGYIGQPIDEPIIEQKQRLNSLQVTSAAKRLRHSAVRSIRRSDSGFVDCHHDTVVA